MLQRRVSFGFRTRRQGRTRRRDQGARSWHDVRCQLRLLRQAPSARQESRTRRTCRTTDEGEIWPRRWITSWSSVFRIRIHSGQRTALPTQPTSAPRCPPSPRASFYSKPAVQKAVFRIPCARAYTDAGNRAAQRPDPDWAYSVQAFWMGKSPELMPEPVGRRWRVGRAIDGQRSPSAEGVAIVRADPQAVGVVRAGNECQVGEIGCADGEGFVVTIVLHPPYSPQRKRP
jgi:hypothetical protein